MELSVNVIAVTYNPVKTEEIGIGEREFHADVIGWG